MAAPEARSAPNPEISPATKNIVGQIRTGLEEFSIARILGNVQELGKAPEIAGGTTNPALREGLLDFTRTLGGIPQVKQAVLDSVEGAYSKGFNTPEPLRRVLSLYDLTGVEARGVPDELKAKVEELRKRLEATQAAPSPDLTAVAGETAQRSSRWRRLVSRIPFVGGKAESAAQKALLFELPGRPLTAEERADLTDPEEITERELLAAILPPQQSVQAFIEEMRQVAGKRGKVSWEQLAEARLRKENPNGIFTTAEKRNEKLRMIGELAGKLEAAKATPDGQAMKILESLFAIPIDFREVEVVLSQRVIHQIADLEKGQEEGKLSNLSRGYKQWLKTWIDRLNGNSGAKMELEAVLKDTVGRSNITIVEPAIPAAAVPEAPTAPAKTPEQQFREKAEERFLRVVELIAGAIPPGEIQISVDDYLNSEAGRQSFQSREQFLRMLVESVTGSGMLPNDPKFVDLQIYFPEKDFREICSLVREDVLNPNIPQLDTQYLQAWDEFGKSVEAIPPSGPEPAPEPETPLTPEQRKEAAENLLREFWQQHSDPDNPPQDELWGLKSQIEQTLDLPEEGSRRRVDDTIYEYWRVAQTSLNFEEPFNNVFDQFRDGQYTQLMERFFSQTFPDVNQAFINLRDQLAALRGGKEGDPWSAARNLRRLINREAGIDEKKAASLIGRITRTHNALEGLLKNSSTTVDQLAQAITNNNKALTANIQFNTDGLRKKAEYYQSIAKRAQPPLKIMEGHGLSYAYLSEFTPEELAALSTGESAGTQPTPTNEEDMWETFIGGTQKEK